jgi:hypothetical protein
VCTITLRFALRIGFTANLKLLVRAGKVHGENLDVKSPCRRFSVGGPSHPWPVAAGVPKGARMSIQLQEYVPEELTRTEKLRIAARVLIKRGVAGNGGRWGLQSRLAEHFGVTRQRVSQIVRQEMAALNADPR